MRMYVASNTDAYLQEITKHLDLEAMDRFLHEHLRAEVDFEELIYLVATDGFEALGAENLCTFVFDIFFYELSLARPIFLKMLLFSILFAFMHKFLVTKNKYISDVSRYCIYWNC